MDRLSAEQPLCGVQSTRNLLSLEVSHHMSPDETTSFNSALLLARHCLMIAIAEQHSANGGEPRSRPRRRRECTTEIQRGRIRRGGSMAFRHEGALGNYGKSFLMQTTEFDDEQGARCDVV